jgi:hypothetical protein
MTKKGEAWKEAALSRHLGGVAEENHEKKSGYPISGIIFNT